MIVSFIEGRIRLRHLALTNAATLQELIDTLQSYPGIERLQPNVRTGSLLIEYDPALISKKMLAAASAALQEQFEPTDVSSSAEAEDISPETALSLSEEASNASAQEEQVMRALEETLKKMGAVAKSESGMLLLGLIVSVGSGFLGMRQWHVWAGSSFAALAMKHFIKRARF